MKHQKISPQDLSSAALVRASDLLPGALFIDPRETLDPLESFACRVISVAPYAQPAAHPTLAALGLAPAPVAGWVSIEYTSSRAGGTRASTFSSAIQAHQEALLTILQ
jgi:hypothetical protein